MLVTHDPLDGVKSIEQALLHHIGGTLRALKAQRKLLDRIGSSCRVVDAEIRQLQRVVTQIDVLRTMRARKR